MALDKEPTECWTPRPAQGGLAGHQLALCGWSEQCSSGPPPQLLSGKPAVQSQVHGQVEAPVLVVLSETAHGSVAAGGKRGPSTRTPSQVWA